jgi:hypothetical protein
MVKSIVNSKFYKKIRIFIQLLIMLIEIYKQKVKTPLFK